MATITRVSMAIAISPKSAGVSNRAKIAVLAMPSALTAHCKPIIQAAPRTACARMSPSSAPDPPPAGYLASSGAVIRHRFAATVN